MDGGSKRHSKDHGFFKQRKNQAVRFVIRDKAHLAFIRKLPCIKCGSTPCDAAHIRMGTGGGIAIKPGDDSTIPLCRKCHREQHRIGERRFYGDIETARCLAGNLYLLSGNIHDSDGAVCSMRFKIFPLAMPA